MSMIDGPDYSARLKKLSQAIERAGADVFIQPVNDEFQGEYTPEYAQRLPWVSGFTGSAGTAVFLAEAYEGKRAILFVDGRYTLQAAQEVNGEDYLIINSSDQLPAAWLKEREKALTTIAFDPWLHTEAQLRSWKKTLSRSQKLQALEENPVDKIWREQPEPPSEAVMIHGLAYAGETVESKRQRVGKLVEEAGAEAALLALPDGINWLLNIRGGDIPYNPLYLCFAIISASGEVTVLSHAPERLPKMDGVIAHDISRLHESPKLLLDYASVLIDPSVSAHWFFTTCKGVGVEVVEGADPTLLPKACKNEVEIEGMREAHRRDGKAVSRFLSWLKQDAAAGEVSELDAVNRLETFRKDAGGEFYQGQSFATISGAGPNGAIVHYRVSEQSNRVLGKDEMYLVDSGGQYLDGTTDITRTIINGTPTPDMIDRYTRVLKGHIAIATALFPEGTTGSQLDVLARQHLWDVGCDYDHGTGHGVGAYLCVHEGPQRISKRAGDVALKAGMILSNEPGYYKDGEYGIRIENLVLVVEKGKTEKGKPLFGFETLTLAPFEDALIDQSILSNKEREWLEKYTATITSIHA